MTFCFLFIYLFYQPNPPRYWRRTPGRGH